MAGRAHHVFLLAAVPSMLAGVFRPVRDARAASAQEPDVIFADGSIYTLDAAGARAEAIAVKDGRILAVGTTQALAALAGPKTRTVALQGRTVLPGFIDAHGHMAALGSLKNGEADLADTTSFDDLLRRIEARAKKARPGEWILGSRWTEGRWDQKEFPTHARLSAITPNNPVLLWRVDGHSSLANRKALALAGVTRQTPNPPGGEILKDKDGEPTGMLIDAAQGLVTSHIETAGSLRDNLLAAQTACLSVGLTGVHDAGLSVGEIALYRKLCDEGMLKLRVYGMVRGGGEGLDYIRSHKPLIGYGGGRFTLRAVKCVADGAMGSRGAWLLQPYSDRPGYSGLCAQEPRVIAAVVQTALANGYQVCTHAIGDRANREVLDVYAAALKNRNGADDRLRIEHAQLLALDDLPRFAQLKVIPSMQPTHATDDMPWAEDRVGPERIKGAYAWASLLRTGARIAAGSDFPVTGENPLHGLYAAITRQDYQGKPDGGWHPEERMTREQALRAFTLDAAFAAFEESSLGSLEVGKLADFAVFDRDIVQCDPRELLTARAMLTVIAGEVVYRRE